MRHKTKQQKKKKKVTEASDFSMTCVTQKKKLQFFSMACYNLCTCAQYANISNKAASETKFSTDLPTPWVCLGQVIGSNVLYEGIGS